MPRLRSSSVPKKRWLKAFVYVSSQIQNDRTSPYPSPVAAPVFHPLDNGSLRQLFLEGLLSDDGMIDNFDTLGSPNFLHAVIDVTSLEDVNIRLRGGDDEIKDEDEESKSQMFASTQSVLEPETIPSSAGSGYVEEDPLSALSSVAPEGSRSRTGSGAIDPSLSTSRSVTAEASGSRTGSGILDPSLSTSISVAPEASRSRTGSGILDPSLSTSRSVGPEASNLSTASSIAPDPSQSRTGSAVFDPSLSTSRSIAAEASRSRTGSGILDPSLSTSRSIGPEAILSQASPSSVSRLSGTMASSSAFQGDDSQMFSKSKTKQFNLKISFSVNDDGSAIKDLIAEAQDKPTAVDQSASSVYASTSGYQDATAPSAVSNIAGSKSAVSQNTSVSDENNDAILSGVSEEVLDEFNRRMQTCMKRIDQRKQEMMERRKKEAESSNELQRTASSGFMPAVANDKNENVQEFRHCFSDLKENMLKENAASSARLQTQSRMDNVPGLGQVQALSQMPMNLPPGYMLFIAAPVSPPGQRLPATCPQERAAQVSPVCPARGPPQTPAYSNMPLPSPAANRGPPTSCRPRSQTQPPRNPRCGQ